jgi:hypothetical protein
MYCDRFDSAATEASRDHPGLTDTPELRGGGGPLTPIFVQADPLLKRDSGEANFSV